MSNKLSLNQRINWVNSLYLILTPFIVAAGLTYWLKSGLFNWATIILALVLTTFCQISITAGYHRLFSHRTYKAAWPVRLFFLIFGAGAFEGSAIHWSLDHRNHHNYVDDNQKDPYSIGRGFFWAHMGWLFIKQDTQLYKEISTNKSGDLYDDPLLVWQLKYWTFVGILVTFVLPTLIAGLFWGDWVGGLFVAGLSRSVINHHSTFLINSLSHCVGKQTYSDTHSARDNLFTAFLTFGEGYHNYHHEFPSDYRNGVRPWDWDPTKWVIKGLSYVGLTSNLKKINEEIIVRKRMMMKEKRMHKKLASLQFNIDSSQYSTMLTRLKDNIENNFKNLRTHREEMNKLLKANQKKSSSFIKLELEIIKSKMNQTRDDFFKAVNKWDLTRRRVLKLAYART